MALSFTPLRGADCNGNGIDDDLEIRSGTSRDCDGNQILDECEVALTHPAFVAGPRVSGPQSGLVFDADGDGDTDLVAVREGSLFAYLNLGDGNLARAMPGPRVSSLACAADLDGDRLPDLVDVRLQGPWVLVGTGTGAFVPTRLIQTERHLHKVVAGDMDRDGRVDLVSTAALESQSSYTQVVVFWNQGNAPFVEELVLDKGTLDSTFIDFDGDADLDLAAIAGRSLWLIENKGARAFAEPVEVLIRPFNIAGSIHAGEIDGDGRTDLVLLEDMGSKPKALRNLGGGRFEAAPWGPQDLQSGDIAAWPEDMDDDGDLDLTVAEHCGALGPVLLPYRNVGGTLQAGKPLHLADFDVVTLRTGVLDGRPGRDLIVFTGAEAALFLAQTASLSDCNSNGLLDACEEDCNSNRIPDECDIADGSAEDANRNAIPDACEPDCNGNGIVDAVDAGDGPASDCNGNGVPDSCESHLDHNGNGIPDACDVLSGASADCNSNGVPDEIDTAPAIRFPDLIIPLPRRGEDEDWRELPFADLEGDGNVDVVSLGEKSILIERGAGTGRFGSRPEEISFGSDISDAVLDDFDGDRDLDLAVLGGSGDLSCSNSPSLAVFVLGSEGGRFRRLGSHMLPWSGPGKISAADLDGDSHSDLLLFGPAGTWMLRGRGNGTFALPEKLVEGDAHGIAVLDADGDGDFDLATTQGVVFLNSGGAFFSGPRFDAFGLLGYLFAADFNSDGLQDLVTPRGVLLNAGLAVFEMSFRFPVLAKNVALGDWDLDGDLDLVTLNVETKPYTEFFTAFLNAGNGIDFSSEVHSTGWWGEFLGPADFDGDGLLDLAFRAYVYEEDADETAVDLLVHWNLGGGRFTGLDPIEQEGSLIPGRPLDVDFDGDIDLVAFDRTSRKWVLFRNSRSGRFAAESLSVPIDDPRVLDIADMDGDGSLDIVASTELGDFPEKRILLGIAFNDQGSFSRRLDLPPEDYSYVAFRPGDLDGDGDVDLATRYGLFVNQGGGRFERRALLVDGVSSLETADMDSDGDQDLIVSIWRAAYILESDGSGWFSSAMTLDLLRDVASLTPADFDLDGNLDLAFTTIEDCYDCPCSGTTGVARNEGNGTFVPIVEVHSLAWEGLTPADLDLDGDEDLVAYEDECSDTIEVFENDGTGKISLVGRITQRASQILPIDVDGDGYQELVLDSHGFYRNRTLPPASGDADGDKTPDECETWFDRGDANEDGKLDLSDAVTLLGFLFQGLAAVPCDDALDVDDSGKLDVTDPVRLLDHLFRGGPEPPPPHECGVDPTPDALHCSRFDLCR